MPGIYLSLNYSAYLWVSDRVRGCPYYAIYVQVHIPTPT